MQLKVFGKLIKYWWIKRKFDKILTKCQKIQYDIYLNSNSPYMNYLKRELNMYQEKLEQTRRQLKSLNT